VIPAEYSAFFGASTQASAALLGLLFVSVSLAPERTFGREAEPGRQALATSSFAALANVFFVSFSSLIPNLPFGDLILVAGVIAAGQTLALLIWLPSWRREHILLRSLALFAVSAFIYVEEIRIGLQLMPAPANTGALTGLLELLLAAYAISLARAWELLGAPHTRGAMGGTFEWIRSRFGAKDRAAQPETPPKTGPS
jgi:hypothetical protein